MEMLVLLPRTMIKKNTVVPKKKNTKNSMTIDLIMIATDVKSTVNCHVSFNSNAHVYNTSQYTMIKP